MSLFRNIRVASVALTVGVLACGDDDEPTDAATNFTATLSGADEVPANASTATGTATFSISGAALTYTVNVTGIQNAVQAHIHVAPVGQNGPIRMNLCGTGDPLPACTSGTGVLVSATNGTTLGITFDELVSAMRTGGAYVNVHTDNGDGTPNTGPGDLANGEIRGQIAAE